MVRIRPIIRPGHKKSSKSGLPPGSLVYVGEERTEDVRVTCSRYDAGSFDSFISSDPQECKPEPGKILWLDVAGIHQPEVLARWGEAYDLHPLVLEDILNTEHRPKLEVHDQYLFLVFKSFRLLDDELSEDQVSLVLGQGYLLSFQERTDEFDSVMQRLAQGTGRLRSSGPDYLAYALIDCVVDQYYAVLEALGTRIDAIEQQLLTAPGPKCMEYVQDLKEDMLLIRKAVWPLREILSALMRQSDDLVSRSTHVYLRDVYDHTVQTLDTVETYRDMIASLFDTYLSSVSLRMNEVMKVLTVIATIFIPLTFITGLYGMNFHHMPELAWKWGYPAALGLMALVVVVMLWYFKRKKWF